MSYVKTNPQPAGINSGETAVTLDDDTVVAVSAEITPQANGSPSSIKAIARAIGADGSVVTDTLGEPVTSVFQFVPSAEQANDPVQFAAVQKDCLMAVLGEPVTATLADPLHVTALANASIRNRLAALAIAGAVDAGALL